MKDNRREFLKKGGALAALSVAGFTSCTTQPPQPEKNQAGFIKDPSLKIPKEPYIKIALQAKPEPTEDDIKFIKQLGIDHIVTWTDAKKSSFEYYNSRRELYEKEGIKVFGFGNFDVHNQDKITLVCREEMKKLKST
jgi:hypothetical protein